MNQFVKMDDDSDFIPCSARLVNFEFRVTKVVEIDPEFLVIKADTDTLVLEFKLALKQKIMKTLQLECRQLRAKLYENLCINLHLVVQAYLITEQLKLNPHKVISTIMHYNYKELFDHTDLDLDEFYSIYKSAHALPTFPFPLDNLAPDNGTDIQIDLITQEAPNNATNDAHTVCLPAKQIIIGAFTRPGTAYFARIEEIKIDISLKKLLTSNTLEESTDATKNRLDVEVSVDNELLEDMIQKKVNIRTKNLNSELGQLKKQIATLTKSNTTGTSTPNTKKDRRGHSPKKGASILKKKST